MPIDPQPLEVHPDDKIAHDADGKPLIHPGNRTQEIRMIGGPMDGQRWLYDGGIFVEMFNPDKEKWGPTERLAYTYEITADSEVVAVFPAMRDTTEGEG